MTSLLLCCLCRFKTYFHVNRNYKVHRKNLNHLMLFQDYFDYVPSNDRRFYGYWFGRIAFGINQVTHFHTLVDLKMFCLI